MATARAALLLLIVHNTLALEPAIAAAQASFERERAERAALMVSLFESVRAQ